MIFPNLDVDFLACSIDYNTYSFITHTKYEVFVYYRWRNWFIRGVFTFVMLAMFVVFIYLGPLSLTVLVSVCVFANYDVSYTLGYRYFFQVLSRDYHNWSRQISRV